MITVQLLGGACLRSGEAAIAGPPAQRHRIALLALVVAAWPQPLSRDRAMGLLWPERDETSARRLLNLAVHVLRSALGEDAIVSSVDALLFEPSRVRCDLHQLRLAMHAGAAEDIVRLYAGPLLDGFHLPDSAEFGYWLDERRNELAHGFLGALRAVAARQEKSGDIHGLVATCRRLVSTDPYSAAHAQALMRALDAAGDRAGAIEHAREYAQRLRADLDLEPDAAVVGLADRLRASAVARSAPNTTPRERVPRVAVLPFVNLSGDGDTQCFADGVTEDVVAHLAKVRKLEVIATTSVTGFKERPRQLADIGATLGVSTILDGSVRRAGDRVRIVAKLTTVEADKHLWAETYDRRLTDIFAIQTDVALHIAAALEAELSIDEQARIRRQPTKDVQAYQLFLQGRQFYIEYTPESMTRAIECFEAALARDPGFALAAAHIAIAYTELCEHGSMAVDVARPRAADAANRALRLDSELSAAHCALGHLKTVLEYDWDGAEQAFERALDLSPSNADAYALYGRLCSALERYEESITLNARARELNPLAHRLDLVTSLVRAGRHEQAIALGEEARGFDPDFPRARATLGWAYFLSGRRDDGIAELELSVSLSGRSTLWLSQLGEAYAMAGLAEKARVILGELHDRARTGFVSPYHFAYLYAGLGEAERAIECLERAVAERSGASYLIKGSFLLSGLHGHPRFTALLRRMKLA